VISQFPKTSQTNKLQRIQSSYSVRDLSRQFGLSESSIRRWTKKGVIPAVPEMPEGEFRYDFYALAQLRRVRELRNRGLTMQQIESELHGQMNLFPGKGGQLIPLPVRRTSLQEALLLHERGDKRAEEMYRRAIREGECIPDAYCNLGILSFDKNEITEAFDHFTNALKFEPRHFESHFNLAHLYFEAGDYRLAQLHYEISAVLEPNSAGVHFNLGLVFAMREDLDAAVTALEKAREYSTEEERIEIEELLEGLTRSVPDKQPIKDLQELDPDQQV
jgi:tetratricopeptide (TPR) repeat protein